MIDQRAPDRGDDAKAWDAIVASGWGPAFAASNVVKYLRRDKAPEHSLESARLYYARLIEGAAGPIGARGPWQDAFDRLELILTRGERVRARGASEAAALPALHPDRPENAFENEGHN